MKFKLRHKETGLFAIGMFDRIPACSLAAEFEVNEWDELVPDYEGETEVWWDGQEAETDPMTHERFLVVEGDLIYPENEFERIPVDVAQEA